LVKSPPELWAECSNAASLARHLGQFGEIRITRLEPETAVAWEGSAARGTVRLEPAGWGTKVFLTATEEGAAPEPEPGRVPKADVPPKPVEQVAPEPVEQVAPEPVEQVAPEPVEQLAEPELPARRGIFARLAGLFGPRPGPPPEPPPEPDLTPPREIPPPAEIPSAAETPPAAESARAAETPPSTNPLDVALDSLGRAHHRPYSRA
jgi:hypothetical protein